MNKYNNEFDACDKLHLKPGFGEFYGGDQIHITSVGTKAKYKAFIGEGNKLKSSVIGEKLNESKSQSKPTSVKLQSHRLEHPVRSTKEILTEFAPMGNKGLLRNRQVSIPQSRQRRCGRVVPSPADLKQRKDQIELEERLRQISQRKREAKERRISWKLETDENDFVEIGDRSGRFWDMPTTPPALRDLRELPDAPPSADSPAVVREANECNRLRKVVAVLHDQRRDLLNQRTHINKTTIDRGLDLNDIRIIEEDREIVTRDKVHIKPLKDETQGLNGCMVLFCFLFILYCCYLFKLMDDKLYYYTGYSFLI